MKDTRTYIDIRIHRCRQRVERIDTGNSNNDIFDYDLIYTQYTTYRTVRTGLSYLNIYLGNKICKVGNIWFIFSTFFLFK